MTNTRTTIRIIHATDADRPAIYRLRHQVYAEELGQHPINSEGALRDRLDDFNSYLIARCGDELVGLVSITPPGEGGYSIDKYFERRQLPFPVDDRLYEIRLLTVQPAYRHTAVAAMLIYAAFRFVEDQGGQRIVAIGRLEVMDLYRRVGLVPLGFQTQAGSVVYELMSLTLEDGRQSVAHFASLLRKLQKQISWELRFPVVGAQPCIHGGAFFASIGETFAALERRHQVINADVLDAWFDPAPGVLRALEQHLPWMLRTSPPTQCEGLLETIAQIRRLPRAALLAGSGSSSLIYLAFRHWLTPASRVLLPEPTYGEYAHVLEQVIGCRVDRFPLRYEDNYRLDGEALAAQLRRKNYDLVVLVNPNNPTGGWIERTEWEPLLASIPTTTCVWVDEAYLDYKEPGATLEPLAARSDNIVVCKSLSKVTALSGARAAYLCGPPRQITELRALSPPWSVSLPAQVAAVAALQDPAYYRSRYAETGILRKAFTDRLRQTLPEIDVRESPANWVLCFLPHCYPRANEIVSHCAARDVFLRDLSSLRGNEARPVIRIAVKEACLHERIIKTLADAVFGGIEADEFALRAPTRL